MASIHFSSVSQFISYADFSPSSSSCRFFPKPYPLVVKAKPHSKVSCKAKKIADHSGSQNYEQNSPTMIERRNVLLGMGALYGATSFGVNPFAFAAPVSPDFSNCKSTPETKNGSLLDCCPPPPGFDIFFSTPYVPSVTGKIYERIPAHKATDTYIKQYSMAIQKMKNLSLTDPRNFYQQANVHCVYCDEGYTQSGFPGKQLDVHKSWLFFPWHRWYLYFFERICKNLLDEDTFTLPFWQWDDPNGMVLPSMYNDTKSSLYGCLRDPKHLPPTVVDLAYSDQDISPPIDSHTQIQNNLYTMYSQMITQSKTPLKFFGKPFRGGDDPDDPGHGAGSIENMPHNCVHDWTGNPAQPHREDMGVLYAAGRDPIFFAHHGNVDRMWHVYKNNLELKDVNDQDWLNSSFVFYNEEARPVRVTIKDSLDPAKLGYTYPDLPIAWLNYKPTTRRRGITLPRAPKPGAVFPRILDKIITVLVDRPRKLRTREEKNAAEETLEIQGIGYDKGEFVKFDVYINEDDPSLSGPDKTEFIGSFVSLPHGHSMKATTSQDFALNNVLEDLGADGYDKILVTLVPKSGVVTITDIRVSFDTSNA